MKAATVTPTSSHGCHAIEKSKKEEKNGGTMGSTLHEDGEKVSITLTRWACKTAKYMPPPMSFFFIIQKRQFVLI